MNRPKAGAWRVDELTGPQKSAVLCMALGPEQAAGIMKRLAPEEVEAITLEIAGAQSVNREIVASVVSEYRDVSQAIHSVAQGGVIYAKDLLDRAVGATRADVILNRIQSQMVDSGLKRLKKAAPEVLLSILRNEHPQSIALILSHLDIRNAASVIETMERELAGDVLYRVASMEKVSPEMLQAVEAGLSSQSELSLSQEMTLSGGPSAVANVLNLVATSSEKALLEAIDGRNHDLAELIRSHMFVFEDLKSLDARSMQRILRDVESRNLAMALKAASEGLKAHVLKNMSERAAAALTEEMEMLGPVRVRDVESIQSQILAAVRALEETGEIVLPGRGGRDELIS